VVSVRVSDHRAIDRPPRVDVESSGGAIEAGVGWLDQHYVMQNAKGEMQSLAARLLFCILNFEF